jgi:Domain of unknown function (DUF397)
MAATGGANHPSGTVWRKSSRSNGGQDACVEIANLGDHIAVRDSKNPSGPVLTFHHGTFRRFTTEIRNGGRARPGR